jgi:hypothetical protein
MNHAAVSRLALAASSDAWASSRLSMVGVALAAKVVSEVPAMEVKPVIELAARAGQHGRVDPRAVRSTMAWPITVAMASTEWRTSSLEIR